MNAINMKQAAYAQQGQLQGSPTEPAATLDMIPEALCAFSERLAGHTRSIQEFCDRVSGSLPEAVSPDDLYPPGGSIMSQMMHASRLMGDRLGNLERQIERLGTLLRDQT